VREGAKNIFMRSSKNADDNNLGPGFFDCEQLGARWHCHPRTAFRRMQRLGIKPMKLTRRSVLFRMTDVARIEAACI
jgi:hypothetical protein